MYELLHLVNCILHDGFLVQLSYMMIRSHMQTRQHQHVAKNPFSISNPSSDPPNISIKERIEDGSIEWTDELESLFFQSFISSSCTYKPVGVSKHFNMLIAYHRFTSAIGRDIDVNHLWTKLESMYDLNALEEGEDMPFPTKDVEFTLDDNDFHQILSEKRKDGHRSRDYKDPIARVKTEDEFSTPPPLAVAKRSTSSSSSSNKRKISTSSHSSNEGKEGSPRKSPILYAVPAAKKRRN